MKVICSLASAYPAAAFARQATSRKHWHRTLPALIFGLLLLTASHAVSAQREAMWGRITVGFHGLKGRVGYLRVALYNRPGAFTSGEPIARRDVRLETLPAEMSSGLITVSFEGLPPGVYAVCAFHDGPGTGKLTQNFLGIPQEEWGMSNNPHPRFHAPHFNQARFNLGFQQDRFILITLHR